MNELVEFFSKLMEVEAWPPRWYCGTWSSFHGWLYIMSDIAIWLAYFFIPVILILFIQKRPNIPFLPVFWLFGAFILLCGMTHILDAIIFWWPAYRLSALIKFFTALASIITVFALIRDLPKLLDITTRHKNNPSDEDVKSIQDQLDLKDMQIESLQKEVDRLNKEN